MNKVVHTLLQAYYDGELTGRTLARFEAHLPNCPECQAELDELAAVSQMLQQAPAVPGHTSPGQFVAQVNLRLPRQQTFTVWQRIGRLSWQLAPLGLMAVWLASRGVILLGNLLAAIGLLPGGAEAVDWLPKPLGLYTSLIQALNLPDLGLSEALDLTWGAFGYGSFWDWQTALSVLLPIVVGGLFLSWLASWWVSQNSEIENH